ncbi:MAG: xanthine dehydrogenase family protein molybdopterin-binding subunit [Rubrivivax sp.]|nr:xanthine dehydrogenase family protein molybdopterin-binding subunit [Rubrivivax sp.]
MKTLRLSRRALLVSGVAGAVGVAFGLPSACSPQATRQRVNAFVRLDGDGRIVLVNPAVEMGQGSATALAQVLADAMDADWQGIRVLAAPYDSAYGNPHFDHRLVTADSACTRAFWPLLREAGAQARAALVWNAARRWQVPPEGLRTEGGAVLHPDGRRVSYADLAAVAELPRWLDRLPQLASPPHRLLGQPLVRLDLADKLCGRTRYAVDQRAPGQWVAVLARPQPVGATLQSVDSAAALAVPGVEQVLAVPGAMAGVAVVARDTWAALQGRAALRVQWRPPETPYDSDAELARWAALARSGAQGVPGAVVHVVRHVGAAPESTAPATAAPRVLNLALRSRHVTHVALEPVNALARPTWMGQGAELLSATQAPSLDMRQAARAMKRPPQVFDVQAQPVGGAFGRRVDNEAAAAAAWLAQTLKGPVQVLQFVNEDVAAGQVRTLAAQHLQATLDALGRITDWQHRTVGSATIARMFSERFAKEGRDQTLIDGQEHLYRVPAQHIESVHLPSPLACGFLRGVGAGFNTLAVESLVDEAARAAQQEGLAYRLQMLEDPRARRVLQALGEMPDPAGPGQASGCAFLHLRGSHIAMRATVQRADGVLQVHRLQAVVDCGRVVNPALALCQVEGAAYMGLSIALREALDFRAGRPLQDGLAAYPLLRAHELPPLDCHFVAPDQAAPQGVGEIALPVVAPAVANAWRTLTGQRLLTTPFEPA